MDEITYFEGREPDFRFGTLSWDRGYWAGYVPGPEEIEMFKPKKDHVWVVNHGIRSVYFEGWMHEDEVWSINREYEQWVEAQLKE